MKAIFLSWNVENTIKRDTRMRVVGSGGRRDIGEQPAIPFYKRPGLANVSQVGIDEGGVG
jgi:hypothetical protein